MSGGKDVRCEKCDRKIAEEDRNGSLVLAIGKVTAVMPAVTGLFSCSKCGHPNPVEVGMDKLRRQAQTIVVDEHGRILSWSKEATKLFGYTADDVLGKHINLVVPEDKRAEMKTIVAKIRHTKRGTTFRTVRRRKSGATFACEITLRPIVSQDGSLVGMNRYVKAL